MALSFEAVIMHYWNKHAPGPYQYLFEESFEDWAAVTIPAVFGHIEGLIAENAQLQVKVKELEARLTAQEHAA